MNNFQCVINNSQSKIIDVTDLTNKFSSNSLRIRSNELSASQFSHSNSPNSTSPNTPLQQSPLPHQTKIKRRKSLRDADFIPYDERPFLSGESEVEVTCSNGTYEPIRVKLPTHWTQFNLSPTYIGTPQNHFIYLNAQDPQFYYMTFSPPKLTVWLLIKNTTFVNTGYVKRRIVEECFRRQWNCHLVNPNKFDLNLSNLSHSSNAQSSHSKRCSYDGKLIPLPDVVIPRVGANVDYFGLAVLRQLESRGVCVLNPSSAIEISRDKLYTHQILSGAGIPIPKSLLSRWPFDVDFIERRIDYPVIVKLLSSSKGEAVWKVDNRQELISLVETLDTKKPIIFQQFLSNSKGRDIRCFVIGNKIVASMMRIAPTGEYKANVHRMSFAEGLHYSMELCSADSFECSVMTCVFLNFRD